MREREIERRLVEFIKGRGGRAYKFISPGNAGVPDRIVILKDMPPVFVELKADGGRLTPLQKVQLDRLRDLGQIVTVVSGAEGLERFKREVVSGDIFAI